MSVRSRVRRPRAHETDAATAGNSALAAHGVGYRVDGRWLLHPLDLELRHGEVLAVVGPNGAGKSTLLGLLSGDLRPAIGTVTIAGTPLPGLHPTRVARRRAVLTQRTEVAFPFTAREVVAMGRAPWHATAARDRDDAVVERCLGATDVADLAERRYPSLSGGEQARVSFARVLAQETPIMLLDEPTAALDLRHQEDLMELVRASANDGRAVLVVLHDLQLAAAHADRIAVLRRGRLVAVGAPDDVLTESLLEATYDLPVDVLRHPDTGAVLIGPRRAPRHTAPDPDARRTPCPT